MLTTSYLILSSHDDYNWMIKNRQVPNETFNTRAQFHQRSTYSFYTHRSRMRKKRHSSQQCHLALFGPTSVKAAPARKTLVKLTPDFMIDLFNYTWSYPLALQMIYHLLMGGFQPAGTDKSKKPIENSPC